MANLFAPLTSKGSSVKEPGAHCRLGRWYCQISLPKTLIDFPNLQTIEEEVRSVVFVNYKTLQDADIERPHAAVLHANFHEACSVVRAHMEFP